MEVATLLGRDLSNVYRRAQRNAAKRGRTPKPVGRPPALKKAQIDRLVRVTESMVNPAGGMYQVTCQMIKDATKLSCSLRTVYNALHARGVRFHPMREKPVRAPVDAEDRLRFAQEHAKKPASYWVNSVHAHMDNETFPVCLTAPQRACAAQRAARGACRARAQGLAQGHVKPRKAVEVNYEKSAMVAVALSARKVIMRRAAQGVWNAAEAAHM